MNLHAVNMAKAMLHLPLTHHILLSELHIRSTL